MLDPAQALEAGIDVRLAQASQRGADDPVGLLSLLQKHVHRVVHVHCKDVRAQVIAQARNDGWTTTAASTRPAWSKTTTS